MEVKSRTTNLSLGNHKSDGHSSLHRGGRKHLIFKDYKSQNQWCAYNSFAKLKAPIQNYCLKRIWISTQNNGCQNLFFIKQKVANLLIRLFLQNLLTCGLEIFGWLEMAGGWLCDYKPTHY